jgi:signal transduction histidine kinase
MDQWLKNKKIQWTARVLLAAGITLVLSQFQFQTLEFFTSDLRMKWTPQPESSHNLLIVPVNEQSAKRFEGLPSLSQFNSMLEKLALAQPVSVVTFINPFKLSGSQSDMNRLAGLSRQVPLILAENDLPPTGLTEFPPLSPPFDAIQRLPAPKTSDRTVFAKDGVTRRAILKYEGAETMYPRLAQGFRTRPAEEAAGAFDFLDSKQIFIRFHDPSSYSRVEFTNIANGRWNSLEARGKIALVGLDTKDAFDQYVTSPLSKNPFDLSQLYVQADSIDTLIQNDAPRPTPVVFNLALTFLVALLTIHAVMTLKPITGLIVLLGTVAGLFAVGLAVFYSSNDLIPLAQPLLAVFLCYYFAIPYRLIRENRRSWEYYQKNKILTQVEELKSNFLKLVSHDLKTPLAKIQGMAEILLKERAQLSGAQQTAVNEIIISADDLEDFVSSLLNLSRVESSEVKLQLRSGDVNRVLEDVIQRSSFHAQRKKITVRKELEPLFSLKIDENLLRQVFTNLIENAIKYSPEGSSILVTSEDTVGGVTIQIADQGMGISEDELPHIFRKFYRAKNAEGSTSGSGLGLYLSKYFVELHSGRLSVESHPHQGSTFTVFLPYELETHIQSGELHA